LNVAIIDAEIIGKTKHRFPNLALMKLSAWHQQNGDNVILKTDYENLSDFDKVFIAKVFTKTPIPNGIAELPNVKCGGTGFHYDKAPPLPQGMEHTKPDYRLYAKWVEERISAGAKKKEFTYYQDYSIGFLTRGCFRKCEFCVNKNSKSCNKHSPILEFIDENRPKLCFLDDNFFACKDWREIIQEVKLTGKKFQFKQGLDERLLTDEKIHNMMTWKYDGDWIFAFDDIADSDVVESKLKRIFELYPKFKKRIKFYVLCGYDRDGKYDNDFWLKDIENTFKRCLLLAKYSALPYIMRYEKCHESNYSGLYSTIASWANQPSLFKKFDFETFAMCRGMGNEGYKKYKRNVEQYLRDGGKKGACWRYMEEFRSAYPMFAHNYFSITPDALLKYGSGDKFTRFNKKI